MYEEKFGAERTKMMQGRLSSIGKEVGINFKFGGRTGNTRNSHRLIQLAKSKGSETQNKLVDALFASYFENELDITSHDVLKSAGVKAGMDEAEIDDWLNSDKGGKQVDEEVQTAMSHIVTGVPNFTIQGKYEVRGAQDAEGFKQIFEKLKAMGA
jgi:predicted DsbA family dithiol-disulfide isomerase